MTAEYDVQCLFWSMQQSAKLWQNLSPSLARASSLEAVDRSDLVEIASMYHAAVIGFHFHHQLFWTAKLP